MELKKNKKYDLESKRPIFFGIGMIISLTLTLVAFEWKSEVEPVIDDFAIENYIDPIYEPPKTKILPPPPPQKPVIIKPVIEEPKEEDMPIVDVDVKEDDDVPIVDIPIDVPEEVVEEPPRSIAEVMPSFKGGIENFYKFIGENVKYPKQAQRMGIEGRVFVKFVVEKDGSLSNIHVVKGIGAGCDEEALRVMEKIPAFIPGKQGDVRVRVQMIVPINFTLQ